MNLDEVFGLKESNPLVSTDPLILFLCILSAVLAGWLCVHLFRDTNDERKSMKCYIPFAVVGFVLFSAAGVPLLFAVGAQACGFVALILISARYF